MGTRFERHNGPLSNDELTFDRRWLFDPSRLPPFRWQLLKGSTGTKFKDRPWFAEVAELFQREADAPLRKGGLRMPPRRREFGEYGTDDAPNPSFLWRPADTEEVWRFIPDFNMRILGIGPHQRGSEAVIGRWTFDPRAQGLDRWILAHDDGRKERNRPRFARMVEVERVLDYSGSADKFLRTQEFLIVAENEDYRQGHSELDAYFRWGGSAVWEPKNFDRIAEQMLQYSRDVRFGLTDFEKSIAERSRKIDPKDWYFSPTRKTYHFDSGSEFTPTWRGEDKWVEYSYPEPPRSFSPEHSVPDFGWIMRKRGHWVPTYIYGQTIKLGHAAQVQEESEGNANDPYKELRGLLRDGGREVIGLNAEQSINFQRAMLTPDETTPSAPAPDPPGLGISFAREII